MKRFKIAGIVIACCLVCASVIAVTVLLSNKYLTNGKDKTATCSGKHITRHVITVQNDTITPRHTEGYVCDTLTITNLDDKRRLMAFGVHTHHTAYDGVTERYLNKGDSFTVTLDQPGTFTLHDHLQDEVGTTFTVNNY